MWHGAPNAQTHGAVSVVTTVYPGVPSFAGPPQSYNTATTHPSGGNMFGPGGHVQTPSSSYVGHQPAPVSKTSSTSSNYGSDGGLYGSHDMQHHHQAYPAHGQMNEFAPNAPRHAVNAVAAAQAAAAAVATATATATAVAIDQSQFQNYPQVGFFLFCFCKRAKTTLVADPVSASSIRQPVLSAANGHGSSDAASAGSLRA